MHIKRIVIQGFKSYKNQTIAGPFSKHHNVVVGRNGSGKSNFFAAIRFVLGDAFKTLGKDDRTQLLHDGAGTSVMSAYVEIVFDNSDGRIMGRGSEVVVRRTVGLKKDEYSLDKKSSSKQEVANLLETAGFSPSNPYYIVPQGRVTSLTNARDSERLKLLKEVAGTEVYETKRSRSLIQISEAQTKREQIDESLESIRSQMEELERETRVLKEYQEKDREKRCLDYTILHRELDDINKKLEMIEIEMTDGAENNTTQTDRLYELEEQVTRLESSVSELKEQLQAVEFEKGQVEQDLQEVMHNHAQAEMEFNDYQSSKSSANQELDAAVQSLRRVESEIQTTNQELNDIQQNYENLKQRETSIKNQLSELTTRKNHLQVKQGRSAKFTSKQEHDNWHKAEIASLQQAIDSRTRAIENNNSDLQDVQQQLAEAEQEALDLQTKMESLNSEKKQVKQQEADFERREAQLNDEKKLLWREQNSIHSRLETARANLKAAEQKLGETMARDMSQGLRSVQRIARRLNLNGVHGTLSELIDFDNKYKTAIEVTAGTSLFHVVVDNDETASTLMEELKRERGGRVTFVPLNRLEIGDIDYPQGDDFAPLIAKLKYNREYDSVVKQVFGKTMVCKNMEVAQQSVQPSGFNAITLQGDRLDNQGVLTGGYTDTRKSRMDATRRLKSCRLELQEREDELSTINKQVQVKEQEITKLLNERSKALSKQNGVSQESVLSEMSSNSRQQAILKATFEQKQQDLEDKKSDLAALKSQLQSHQSDLAAGFNKTLSNEELQELESCRQQIPNLQSQLNTISSQVAESSTTKSNLEFTLNESLIQQKSGLQTQISQLESESLDDNKEQELRKKVETLVHAKDKAAQDVASLDAEIEQKQQQIAAQEEQMAQIKDEQLQVGRSLERQRKKMDSRMAKKAGVEQRKQFINSRIRELGVIPEEAWSKFKNMSSPEIVERNRVLGEELKGYSYVNKKALEQYNNFQDKRDELEQRRDELESSEESITELIDSLDARKDEAITQTFRKVSKSFSEVFKKLVPAGTGRLIMQRRSDDESTQSQTQTQLRDGTAIENYTGVAISVSFNSEVDEQLRIEQLSGGQKSLCALALIFAIQMCDPAPFYLFDEVDANLDTQYRTAVAEMIRELSQQGQFICTTFRPEMIEVASGFYGVSFKDSMSSIAQISREQAAQFIEGASRM